MIDKKLQHLIDDNDWKFISMFHKLTEDFIRQYLNKLYWISISIYQTLSEDFIREFQDKVDWDYISISQELSEDFIKEFQDRLKLYSILSNKRLKLSNSFRKELELLIKIENI